MTLPVKDPAPGSCTSKRAKFSFKMLRRTAAFPGVLFGALRRRREKAKVGWERTPSPATEQIDPVPASADEDDLFDSVPRSTLTSTASADDDEFFAPCPPRPECPICLITLPFNGEGVSRMACCGNRICSACEYERRRVMEKTNEKRTARNPDNPCLVEDCCPLCRELSVEDEQELLARLQERVERKKAYAFSLMGDCCCFGLHGVPKDERKAFEHWVRAAELGYAKAYYSLAIFYQSGDMEGVDEDWEKSRHYFLQAAKGGYDMARYCLGQIEYEQGNDAVAYRHWRISAAVGCDKSMNFIRLGFDEGMVTKDEYEMVKREHHMAKEEMKSEQRDEYFERERQEEEMQEDSCNP